MTIPNWDLIGHTMISSDFIRITPDQQSRSGGVWNRHVCYWFLCYLLQKFVTKWILC